MSEQDPWGFQRYEAEEAGRRAAEEADRRKREADHRFFSQRERETEEQRRNSGSDFRKGQNDAALGKAEQKAGCAAMAGMWVVLPLTILELIAITLHFKLEPFSLAFYGLTVGLAVGNCIVLWLLLRALWGMRKLLAIAAIAGVAWYWFFGRG